MSIQIEKDLRDRGIKVIPFKTMNGIPAFLAPDFRPYGNLLYSEDRTYTD